MDDELRRSAEQAAANIRIRRTTLIWAAVTREGMAGMTLRWIAYAAGEGVGDRASKPRDPNVSIEDNAQAAQAAQAMIESIIDAHEKGTLRKAA